MPGGIWGECLEVCRGSVGHNRVGHPTLETAGVLPSALHAEMAPDTGTDADHDAFNRGATINPLWHPSQGHLYPQPCDMGKNSCPPAVLAGPHDKTIVRRALPAGQRPGKYTHT